MDTQVRLWAILGEAKVGKSTSIGFLTARTGKGPGGSFQIPLRGGGFIDIYARRQSLQEAERKPADVVAETNNEIEKINRQGIVPSFFNVLYAIRTDEVNDLPSADQYLSHFVSEGWSIESLVVLGYSKKDHKKYYKFGAPLCEFSEAPNLAKKKAASTHHLFLAPIRNHFGWA